MINFKYYITASLTVSIILFLQLNLTFAQINWTWAASGGRGINSYSYSLGCGIDFDENKNTYLVGTISTPAKVDTLQLYSYGNSDILIAKYDYSGNPIWAKTAGGINSDYATSVKYKDGFLYVCGIFYDTAHFDSQIIYDGYAQSFFVAKINAINGNYVWIRHGDYTNIGNAGMYKLLVINADNLNHVYLCGFCCKNAQLIDTVYTTSASNAAFFITQLDTSGNMNWIHFKKIGDGSAGCGNEGIDMTIDKNSNVIYTSSIKRTDTVSVSGTQSGYDNLLLGKINSAGIVYWEKEFGDTIHDLWYCIPNAISTDDNCNIYVSGIYMQSFILNPSAYSSGGFISKFRSSDGSVVAATPYHSNNGSTPWFTGCDYNYDGNIIYSGGFCGTVDFGGISLSPISSVYDCDNFIVSFDTTGILNWAARYGYYNWDDINASNSNGNMYAITGNFIDSLTLGPFSLYADTLQTNSRYFYIGTQIKDLHYDIISIPNTNLYFNIYPNPTSSYLIFETSDDFKKYSIDIYNISSKLIRHYSNPASNNLDVSELTPGIYFISLRSDKIVFVKSFIKN